jgi:hypothetical protein
MRFGQFCSIALMTSVGVSVAFGALVAINGCTTEPWDITFRCDPDASPDSDKAGDCFPDGGNGLEPASMKCEDRGGQCVEMGTADFRERAVLVWIGEEGEEPSCPERADSEFYRGYSDIGVYLPCQACSCGPATCALPNALEVTSSSFCQGANPTVYSAPAGWDGSCASPSALPTGSFVSIKLAAPTVSGCEPIGDPLPGSPSFAPHPASFSGGINRKSVVACQGSAEGKCESAGDLCLPSTEPPPPEFRQCVQYTLPVDEANPPQCPEAFPERFVFYGDIEGKVECSPCECGEPVGAKCEATMSVFQDPACGTLLHTSLATAGLCIDFGAPNVGLGSMAAQWTANDPGTCEAKGGEPVGQVKGLDPRVFCCQGLAAQ